MGYLNCMLKSKRGEEEKTGDWQDGDVSLAVPKRAGERMEDFVFVVMVAGALIGPELGSEAR